MFTAKLKDKVQKESQINFIVEYTDGVKTIEETYTLQATITVEDSLEDIVERQLKFLNNAVEKYTVGTDITPRTKTVDMTAREKWNEDILQLEYLVHLESLGVIPSDQAELVAQRQKVVDGLKPKYLK